MKRIKRMIHQIKMKIAKAIIGDSFEILSVMEVVDYEADIKDLNAEVEELEAKIKELEEDLRVERFIAIQTIREKNEIEKEKK